MKDNFDILDLRARRIALTMAIANTLLGIAIVVHALYLVATLVLAIVPIMGYGMLIGYWQRFAHKGAPRNWLWINTIWFNLIPLLLPLLAPELFGEPWLYAVLAWNGLMVTGAYFAKKWDARLITLLTAPKAGWLERIEEELPA